MRALAGLAAVCVAAIGSTVAGEAHAACDGRPTDAGAYKSISTGAPAFFDSVGGRVRVHYATTGSAAIDQTTTAPNTAPDFAVRAAEIAEDAVTRYDAAGYRAIPSDDGTCASDGGDGRIDIYFVTFTGGDGQTLGEVCASGSCSGYILVEASPVGYDSDEEALQVIVPHELFHAVQLAYTPDLDAWLSEATAQWAADRLEPTLTDMESFFPAWFDEADRSIDSPPGGAAGAYLYGSAVFPVFLEQAFDDKVVLDTFEGIRGGADIFPALDAALTTRGSSVIDAIPTFQAYTLATGSRRGEGGYTDGASYPMRDVAPLAVVEGALASDVLIGFGSRMYAVELPTDTGSRLTLTADPARIRAHFVPSVGGKADLANRTELGEVVSGAGFIVVAGVSTSKQDAPFSITRSVEALPATTTSSTASTGATTGGGTDDDDDGGETDGGESGGCDCTTSAHRDASFGWLVALGAAVAITRRRRR